MACPQKENGFVPIASEIVDAFQTLKISGNQWNIIMVILRKTYGYQKKSDWIANSQIVKLTGIQKQNVCRELKELQKRRIVIKNDYFLKFNKDYSQWRRKSNQKRLLVIKTETHNRKRTKATKEKERTNALLEKERKEITNVISLPKKNNNKKPPCDEAIRLAEGLLGCILHNNPNHRHNDNTVIKWAEDVDKMIRLDEREPIQIEQIIKWCQADDFWKSNILSGSKLRIQFDQLWIKAKTEHEKSSKGRVFQA